LKTLVHGRDIAIRTYDLGESTVLVEGRLRDERHRQREGEGFEGPFLIHDMAARLTIRGPEMVIQAVEAEMPHHPREGCADVLPWMQKLVGTRIASGFTQRVKRLVGDVRGCAHLTSLLITLGPAAVQGYWAAYGVGRNKLTIHDPRIKMVVNTCYLWREDGPLIEQLRRGSGDTK
jgi:hypothetical protein